MGEPEKLKLAEQYARKFHDARFDIACCDDRDCGFIKDLTKYMLELINLTVGDKDDTGRIGANG